MKRRRYSLAETLLPGHLGFHVRLIELRTLAMTAATYLVFGFDGSPVLGTNVGSKLFVTLELVLLLHFGE
jgi:hypothetical protein